MFKTGYKRITDSEFAEVVLHKELADRQLCVFKSTTMHSGQGEPAPLIFSANTPHRETLNE